MPTAVPPQGSEPAGKVAPPALAATTLRPLRAEVESAAESDARLRLRAVRKLLLAAQRLVGETGEEEAGQGVPKEDSVQVGQRNFGQDVQQATGTPGPTSVPAPSSPEGALPRFVGKDGEDIDNEESSGGKSQMTLRELSDEIALLLAEGD